MYGLDVKIYPIHDIDILISKFTVTYGQHINIFTSVVTIWNLRTKDIELYLWLPDFGLPPWANYRPHDVHIWKNYRYWPLFSFYTQIFVLLLIWKTSHLADTPSIPCPKDANYENIKSTLVGDI